MRLDDQDESNNVEDRRGENYGGGGFGNGFGFGRGSMGIGTLIASMLPYSIALGVVWTIFLIVWFLFGLPVGPGGPIHL